jgi:PhnB protein
MAVKPIPKGYHTVTPYLTVRDAPKVIEFVKQAFGAKLSHEMKRPDGSIMHAEIVIGDSPVMIADENEMAKATLSSLYGADGHVLWRPQRRREGSVRK